MNREQRAQREYRRAITRLRALGLSDDQIADEMSDFEPDLEDDEDLFSSSTAMTGAVQPASLAELDAARVEIDRATAGMPIAVKMSTATFEALKQHLDARGRSFVDRRLTATGLAIVIDERLPLLGYEIVRKGETSDA